MIKPFTLCTVFLFFCFNSGLLMAEEMLIIDDRQSNGLASNLGSEWRMVSDGVMGGVSSGSLALDSVDGKKCLHLRGSVRLENSGGFLQAALDIERTAASNASTYQGLLLEVYGNNEVYNLHLRTDDIQRPWQSYRASFNAPAQWLKVKLPFDAFTAYRIEKEMDTAHLKRIGIAAIGRAFTADLCIARLALY